jgi:hypothetical protein
MFLISVLFIGASFVVPDPTWSALLSALGVNFLTGAVGAALVEVLIKLPQRYGQHRVTRHDVESAVAAGLRPMRMSLDAMTEFALRYARSEALDEAGVAELMATRADAWPAMSEAVASPRLTQVRIMGIMLNDFLRDAPGSIWTVLKTLLTSPSELDGDPNGLTVKVLIVDPRSLAAHLITSEVGGDDQDGPGHRHADLTENVRHLLSQLRLVRRRVEARRAKDNLRLSFEYRLTRALPPGFLFITDDAAFLQPYYLNGTVGGARELPVLRYDANSAFRDSLVRHFDTLWTHAAVAPHDAEADPIRKPLIRVEQGAALSGLVHVYTNGDEALQRMATLLGAARRRVWIQGISNAPIMGDVLSDAFQTAAFKNNVAVRVLILDPSSNNARRKTFTRYHDMKHPSTVDGWPAYADRHAHRLSDITRNINLSLHWFSDLASRANALSDPVTDTGLDHLGSPHKMWVRLCRSVEAFVLIVDDVVLLEPYHFGAEMNNEYPAKTRMQLADNMPLFEFHAPKPAPFLPRAVRLSALEIYSAHFRRVFEDFAKDVPPELIDDLAQR